jgi:hypothetical protein
MKYFIFIILISISGVGKLNSQMSLRIFESDICIEGSSNIHEWISYVHWMDAQYIIKIDEDKRFSISNLCIDIPVKAIFSQKGTIMDNKTWEALKEDQFPNITYTFQEIKSKEKIENGYLLNTVGLLEIAGVQNQVYLPVYAYELEEGIFQFYGEKKISMIDYNVLAPQGVLGYVKVDNEVSVRFDLSLKAENLNQSEVIKQGIPKKQIN